MAKYYVNCGSLQIIMSRNISPMEAATVAIWEANEHDTLDEYMYVDERGYKNYSNAMSDTSVFPTDIVMKKAGWSIEP